MSTTANPALNLTPNGCAVGFPCALRAPAQVSSTLERTMETPRTGEAVNHIRIDLFKDSRDEFLSLLSAEKLEYSELQLFSAGTVVASGMSVMVSLVEASAPWVAFSAVLVAWLKSKSSRKVIITTRDETVVHIEGLSPCEVEKILGRVERIALIDTRKSIND